MEDIAGLRISNLMEFRIADTFTDSLARLTGEEQKAVKTTAFDLQLNPASPGMSFHKLDKAKDQNFWSVRVNSDIRLIVHKIGWQPACSAMSTITTRPMSGPSGASWKPIPRPARRSSWRSARRCRRSSSRKYVEAEPAAPKYAPDRSRSSPRSPTTSCWATACRPSGSRMCGGDRGHAARPSRSPARRGCRSAAGARDRRQAERAAAISASAKPRRGQREGEASPFDHPDAQRRFRVMANVEELQRALDYPVGEVDGLPPPRAAAIGRARLQRAGARLWLGRHGQDDRGAASGRPSGPHAIPTPGSC